MALPEQTYKSILTYVEGGMGIKRAIRQSGIGEHTYYNNIADWQRSEIREAKLFTSDINLIDLTEEDQMIIYRFCEKFDAITRKQVIRNARLRAALVYCVWFHGEYPTIPIAKTLGRAWGMPGKTVERDLHAYINNEKDVYIRKIVREVCGG